MDVRQLRVFAEVAGQLSFRRAAEALHLSQATVSETVRALERDVGGALLTRTSRRVELTEEGRAFLAAALDVVARLDRLRSETRERFARTPGTVVVGEPAACDDATLSAVTDAVERATGRVVRPVELSTAAGVVALRARSVDLAVVLLPLADGAGEGVSTAPVRCEPLGLLVPPGHALHAAAQVPAGALAGEEVHLFPREDAPGYWDAIAAGLAATQPGALLRGTLATRAVARVTARRHLVLVTEGRRERVATTDVSWLPLPGLQKVTALAARADDGRPWVAAALDAVRRRRERPGAGGSAPAPGGTAAATAGRPRGPSAG